jgi:glycosyltransferase involved in cell wall biosynthesis
MPFPRVLIIAPVKINQETGSGVTTGNFFHDWPTGALAQIHSDAFTTPDKSICDRFFFVPRTRSSRFYGVPSHMRALAILLSHISSSPGLLKKCLPWAAILNWAADFSPDVIFARPTDTPKFFLWFTHILSRELKVPYVTCIFDDWPARFSQRQGFLDRHAWKAQMDRKLRAFLKGSVANLAISQEMCAAFSKRYHCEFIPFQNCIDISDWAGIQKVYANRDAFSVVYIGAVTEDKELKSLIDIRNAVLSLAAEGKRVTLTIYGPSLYKKTIETRLLHLPHVSYGGFFPPDSKPRVLSEADLLVLPINFDERSLAYVGYSFQTKVPEYMASGTPMLVYGPPTSPNVSYARREGCAIVVDRPDPEALKKAIADIVENDQKRAYLGKHARDLAFKNHNAANIRDQFLRIMCESAGMLK